MKEILEFVTENTELTVSNPTPMVTTVKWDIGLRVSFYLHISKREELGYYMCSGAIVIERNGTDRVETINVSKQLYSEKEVINLIEEMISSSKDLNEFIENKSDYLNY